MAASLLRSPGWLSSSRRAMTMSTASPEQASSKAQSWRRKALSYALQAAVVVAILWGVTEWQARGLLAERTAAPSFTLSTLDGREVSLQAARGRKVVLYFFAPWCTVCEYSSHNIRALREARTEQELAVYAVGLEWEAAADLERFAHEHELNVPVLQGTDRVRRDYHVNTFPTVYILDERGAVQDRVVGYTTELGLRLRSL
jgi:peroxiredoxin